MRKIKVMEHISLDGVIQLDAPNADSDYTAGDWTAPYRGAEGAAAVAEAFGNGFDLLLGRRTYDLWTGHWPKMKGGPFAEGINAATKYVATHRADSLAWGPVGDLGADAMERIRRLKSQDGPDLIVWGSSTLTTLLFEQGLVDDLVMVIYPLLVGRGKRCFPDTADARKFALVSSKAMPTGVVISTYQHIKLLRTE